MCNLTYSQPLLYIHDLQQQLRLCEASSCFSYHLSGHSKDYIDGNLEGAGECITRLEKERRVYLAMIEQKQQEFAYKQGM
jgi:hypothetical protein